MHLNDEQCDAIDDAIEKALWEHWPVDRDSRCRCGALNNMDGDVLHGHILGALTGAVGVAIAKLPAESATP